MIDELALANILLYVRELDRYAGHVPDMSQPHDTIPVPVRMLRNIRQALKTAGLEPDLEDIN